MFKTCALVNISKQSLLKPFQTSLKYLLSNMIQETSETEVKDVKDSFCQNNFFSCIFEQFLVKKICVLFEYCMFIATTITLV